MRSLSLLFLIIGIIFITIGYNEKVSKCPLPKIEYRYIPRNFYEEQNSQVNLKNLSLRSLSQYLVYPRNSSFVSYNISTVINSTSAT